MIQAILGLDVNDYNTSAALLADGKIVSAAQEERFNREKLTRRFPLQAMNYCLSENGLDLGDLQHVAVSVNPAIYLESLNPGQSERARFRGEILYGVPNYLLGLRPGVNSLHSRLLLDLQGSSPLDIRYITHHDAHAGIAYFASPFEEAAVLSVDGFGEKETCVTYRAAGNKVTRLQSVEFPQSIGLFYAAITEFLGFRPFDEEWKIMGASAYGDPTRFRETFRDLLRYTGDGGFEVDLPCFNYYQFHRPGTFHPRLAEKLGPSYTAASEPDQRFFDIAAGAQQVTEEVIFAMLRHLHGLFPCENLCLTGGVALNCVMNGKIPEQTPFRNLFVPPMPDDSGTSLGAALWAHYAGSGVNRDYVMEHNFLGPSFPSGDVEETLKTCKIRYTACPNPEEEAARLIAGGKIVGWFQGGMEFGDRALGNRSILADPRDPAIKDRVNHEVKFREPFRPFAPSILAHRAAEYFRSPLPSPFMEKALPVLESKQDEIPSVVHVDGTARLQTVTLSQNPLYYRLIEAFDQLTGVPLVLNTSLNVRGEPIVRSPRDALRTFFSCGMDALIVDRFLIRKEGNGAPGE